MRQYHVPADATAIDHLRMVERPEPACGPGEVLLRVRAASLNFRDLNLVEGRRGPARPDGFVPCSDGAGEVVAVGAGVRRLKPGDRAVACFFQGWADGDIRAETMQTALGGALDGILAERVALAADALLPLPPGLSFEEGATLPCAAVTAWHALVEKGGLAPGQTIVLLGTGGVSIFALQFAKAAGARVILTSSSEEKLAAARRLGADATINYKATPDWDQQVLALTGGVGADHVVEVGGAGTLPRSLQAVRFGGRVSLIGVLTGAQPLADPYPILRKSIVVQGIYVGSRAMQERMHRAIVQAGIKPVIDRVFPFEEAPAAYRYMKAAGHFGKIVIRM
ncbi:MAG: NAD(P)-dependent alcohol dehydrogenase [Alphaproteobacteria bacterium]|nr:NAD(P)-dependent alcohol dehydrogenase [Alphaproteobacteria bacterium]